MRCDCGECERVADEHDDERCSCSCCARARSIDARRQRERDAETYGGLANWARDALCLDF